MTSRTAIVALVTVVISLFATNSFAQNRVTPGVMGGGLLGVSPGGTATVNSTDLVLQRGHQFYGRIYAYHGSHFEIYSFDGTVLKSYANGCRETAASNGVRGMMCSFGQMRNGQVAYSGWALIYENGYVYLRWMYDFTAGYQRNIDTDWVGLMPRS